MRVAPDNIRGFNQTRPRPGVGSGNAGYPNGEAFRRRSLEAPERDGVLIFGKDAPAGKDRVRLRRRVRHLDAG